MVYAKTSKSLLHAVEFGNTRWIIIISGLPPAEHSRFLIHEASSPPSRCWARNERCGMENLWPQFRGKLICRFVPAATCQAGVGLVSGRFDEDSLLCPCGMAPCRIFCLGCLP